MNNRIAEIYNSVIKLYQTELKDIAEGLEKTRKVHVIIYNIFTVVFFIICGCVAFGVISTFLLSSTQGMAIPVEVIVHLSIIVVVMLVSVIAFFWGLRSIVFNHYASGVKKKLFVKLYKALDKNLTYLPGKFKLPVSMYGTELFLNYFKDDVNPSFLLESHIRNLGILPEYDYIRVDDSIMGSYNNHEVQIIEFSLIKEQVTRTSKGGRRTKYVEVFHGALFQTSMEKQVKTSVFLKQKGSNLTCPYGLERVKLESNEFEKIFETYSNDQIEARYFLNTATMQKLIDINNSGQKLSGYIRGNSVSVLIHSNKDMFEPDLHKPVNNPNNYFEVIFQAKLILDIITQLNLDSKTGL